MNPKPSSLDFYAFLKRYSFRIEGSFIKKVYQSGTSDFVLQLYGSETGKNYLMISLSKGIIFYDGERPDEATPLSMLLRKILSERRIIKVEQINFDRVVKLTLHTGQEIILEMFREGNLIVTNDGKIEFATEQREWKNRKILRGEQYVPPSLVDPLIMGETEIRSVLETSKASAVQTLATRMNLGGDIAEELLYRISIDKALPSREISSESKRIRDEFSSILEEAELGKGYFFEKQNLLSPIEMKHLQILPTTIYGDLNEGMVDFIKNHFPKESDEDHLSRRLESMKKSIEEFKIKRSKYTEAGKAIMADIPRIDGIIRQMSRSFSSSGRIDKGQIYSGFRVKSFDPAKRTVTVETSGQEFELNLDRTAGQNASDYFARSKDFKSKIEGAMKAIEDTDRAVMKQAQPVKKKRRREWFETYHWFVSSEGFLVIAGRDAKSNEKIVKRHLKDHDIYVHAEVYGAPSTVIKVEGENQPGDSTLREACNFSVAFSRAWSAGLSSGTAYWVLPSQVSKTPESGEFVTTGSWIVRGKRNYYFDLPMDLYISMYESRGALIPMIHPAFPEGKNGDKNVHIVPGDMKRQQVAGEIAKRLGIEKEEIEGILPPGGSSVAD